MVFGIILGVLFGIGALGTISVGVYLLINNEAKKKVIALFVVGALCLIVFVLVPFGFVTVNTGEVAVVRHLGKINGVDEAGVHYHFWMTDKVVKYDSKVRSAEFTTGTYAKDNQLVDVVMNIQYKIDTSKVKEIATVYGSLEALESKMQAVALERVKSAIAKYNAEQIITNRQELSNAVSVMVSEALVSYNVTITNVSITEINFSASFENAIEQSMIAKQEKEKATFEAEKKIIEAQNKIAIAQAEADAKKAQATGEAEAKKIQAEADAKALETVNAVWKELSPEVKEAILKKLAIEKWDGKLPETMVGSDFLNDLLGALQQTPQNA